MSKYSSHQNQANTTIASPRRKHFTFFHTHCGACGRPLLVPVEMLGEPVACSHCHYEFQALEQEIPVRNPCKIERPGLAPH